MISVLDAWFDRVAGAVHAFGGEVLKFIGDGVLAIFPVTGAPVTGKIASPPSPINFSTSPPKACTAPATRSNQASSTAIIVAGSVASDRAVKSSRLEGLCRPLGRSVLISGAVAAETTAPLVPLGEHVLRGIAAPCAVFTLTDA